MGAPYLANLQSGVFYPPSLLLLLPLPLGFNLFLFAHYLIALSGAWMLAARLKEWPGFLRQRAPRCSRSAAIWSRCSI